MKAIRLRTEYLETPLGLGTAAPRFYWNCEGGIAQSAYQIMARRGGEVVWDSGRVESAAMTHIPYAGALLKSRDRIDWSVRLWDEEGVPGPVSESWFELGLLEQSDWRAMWISGNYKPKKDRRYPVDCFRKRFVPDGASKGKRIRQARLYASARGIYDVTVNGKRLEDFILAPGITDYRKRIQYQVYDVTEALRVEARTAGDSIAPEGIFRPEGKAVSGRGTAGGAGSFAGRHTLELRLADGWYRGSTAAYGVTNVYGNQTSAILQLEITYEDGEKDIICTDSSWEWSGDGPIRFADLKDGEIVDAAMHPSYSGRAIEVKPPAAELVASDNVSVRERERFSPRLLVAADRKRVLDFGQNIAGYLEFTVKGDPGQRLKLICGEVLDGEGHVDLSGIQETRPAGGWSQMSLIAKLTQNKVKGPVALTPLQEVIFSCSGGEDHYKTAFSVFGFRYVQVESDMEIDPERFAAIAVYSHMEQTGEFACSEDDVNRLVENTRWSMKGNFLDIPTDCPTRERLGWTGDAQIFFRTGAYLMDTAPFFAKWLRDMEDAQYRNGLLPAVIPYEGVEMMYKATGSSVGWADAVYLIPYRYWKCYGDVRLLGQYWPMMKKYADYLLKHLEKDGHYEKGVHLGEWLEPEEFREQKYGTGMKHPEECTAYLYLAMTVMAEIAAELGEADYAHRLQAVAGRAKSAYPAVAELDTHRQAKLVRPLALGLLEGEAKQAVEKRLRQAVEKYDYRVGTGFLSTPFLLSVLTEAGEVETAYRMLLNEKSPSWISQIKAGATTVWEDWEGKLSQNHYSPGAVCQWLFDTVCGIRPGGENRFVIAPMPGGGLTWAEASYKSIYGRVESRWERTGNERALLEICVPVNCTAEICHPDGKRETVSAGRHRYELILLKHFSNEFVTHLF